jgi:hypothetical protein
MGVDEHGTYLGRLKSAGLRPAFMQRLDDLGIRVRPEVFAYEPPAHR